ncbi:MAG: 23S rRNA (pseudouridine(1915)-N(3))-methyltransferase RlmH [Candidatus Aquicultorales bacterium]
MDILILAVGKLKEEYFRGAAAEYIKRLGRYCRVSVTEVPEEDISSRTEQAVLGIEADRLLAKVPEGYHRVALDRQGKEMGSEEFAAHIEKLTVAGKSRFVFLIGGPLGLSPRITREADLRLSLSRMTFPHQLARIFLLEQLYRAFKIIKNEPYHY